MRFCLPLLLFFVLHSTDPLRAQTQDTYALVRISLGEKTMADLAVLGIETDHGRYIPGRSLETVLDAAELQLVQQAGFEVAVVEPDVVAWYRNAAKAQSVTQRSGDCDAAVDQNPLNVTTPVNYTYGSMGGYHTYDELLAVVDAMADAFPNLISVRQPVSDTLLTHEGRPVWWVRISDNPMQDEGEPELLYTALHHAREPNSASQMLFFMWYLLENYATDPVVQYLVNESAMVFVPCVNPDGYVYNETIEPEGGGLWRKNRRDNGNGTFGVDLNRNYGYQWGFDNIGSSGNPSSATYRGPSAFSEPETRMMRDFCLAHNFRLVLNYHTFSNILIYPFAYNNETADPAFPALARLLTRDNGYISGTTRNVLNYDVNGSSDDWMHAATGTYSFTPEVGPPEWSFWPLPSEIDGLNKANVWANLAAALSAVRYGTVENDGDDLMRGIQDTFQMTFRRYGLEDGPISVTLTPLSALVTSPPFTQTFDIGHLETAPFLPVVTLETSIVPGSELLFLLEVNNGFVSFADTLRKKFVGERIPLLADAGDGFAQFAGNWSVTQEDYVTPAFSFTDSPYSTYTPLAYLYWETTQPVFIPADAVEPRLQFWTRWNIEDAYDFAQVLASGNGGTYVNLCGRYTTPGTDQQPADQPIYDGVQTSWVYECMDLSAFIGQSVSLRFELLSDGAVERDGIYIDDVLVYYHDTTAVSSVRPVVRAEGAWQVWPNPANGQTAVYWSEQHDDGSLFLVDATGKTVRRWVVEKTQDRVPLALNGLPEGVYTVVFFSNSGTVETQRLVVGRR